MIATLTGTISHIGEAEAVLEVGGVGYRIQASNRCLARLGAVGDEARVLVETHIRDDRMVLTGFADAASRDAFNLLQSVQGVGSKAALAILSALAPDDLLLAIAAGDKAMITRADGVGPKLAARIVNELADKVADIHLGGGAAVAGNDNQEGGNTPADNAAQSDTVSALVNLGYGRSDAHATVARIIRDCDKNAGVEVLVPLALKELAR